MCDEESPVFFFNVILRIAEFHCVILLPHGPNALRLSDVYAASIPVVVPEEPGECFGEGDATSK